MNSEILNNEVINNKYYFIKSKKLRQVMTNVDETITFLQLWKWLKNYDINIFENEKNNIMTSNTSSKELNMIMDELHKFPINSKNEVNIELISDYYIYSIKSLQFISIYGLKQYKEKFFKCL